jgi:hypothetical protein
MRLEQHLGPPFPIETGAGRFHVDCGTNSSSPTPIRVPMRGKSASSMRFAAPLKLGGIMYGAPWTGGCGG